MSKIFRKQSSVVELEDRTKQALLSKYYNLYQNTFKWTGVDPEQRDYILRRFWAEGTCAAFKIKDADVVGFAPWTTQTWNMYDFPEEVLLVNKRGVPFIPMTTQVVDKDVVLGWYQRNHKPVMDIVSYYIDRITQVEMVINTNLQVSKMPWFIGVTPADKKRMEDIVDEILHNEVVVFADLEEVSKLQAVSTNTPYIIDKLNAYKNALESELLTYLGIDNVGSQEKQERLLVDEVNAGNDQINDASDGFQNTIEEWLKGIKDTLGFEISVEPTHQKVDSIHNDVNGQGGAKDPKKDSKKEDK